MAKLHIYPDDIEIDCKDGETVLDAALRAEVQMAHICGGKAKCSTCRIWLLEGAGDSDARNPREAKLAEQIGLAPEIRLACQFQPQNDLSIRRLVLDETDILLSSQLGENAGGKTGELKHVAVFFSDICGFTSLSENLPPYDVLYLLNRYFAQMGEIVETNGGYVDKFVGDGMMALFGIDDAEDAPLMAVNAGLQSLAAIDRLRHFLKATYALDFSVRIGLHWGEAVIGTVGSIGNRRVTAIGDAVNVASRVEAANKEAGTRMLISEALFEKVREDIEVADFVRVRLSGTSQRMTLYEVAGLNPEAATRLHAPSSRTTLRFAGRNWTRLIPEQDMTDGQHRVFEFPEFDLAVIRRDGHYFAFNNACPHINLPLFNRARNICEPEKLRPDESEADEGEVVCRWHRSRFDIQTGEVIIWCELLNEDGTSEGMESLGDISKNRAPLRLFPAHVRDGYVWVSTE